MTAVLKITDGIKSVSLVGASGAFHVTGWSPSGVGFKGDGYWRDSSMADGRYLSMYRLQNVSETITISQKSASQDEAIFQINRLAEMLLSASDYSAKSKRGQRPIYLEVRATNESNTRYALLHAGFVGSYGNPFAQPFLQPVERAAVRDVNIVIERGHWQDSPPGVDSCQFASPTGTRIGDLEVAYYDYSDLVLANAPHRISYPPFAFYKLNETSGLVAHDSTTNQLDGDHDASNTLDNLNFWNGEPSMFGAISSGGVDIYSSGFNTQFSGSSGSLNGWFSCPGPMWTGGNDAYFIRLAVDSDNYISVYHDGTQNDTITWEFSTNGDIYSTTYTFLTDIEKDNVWFSVGVSWTTSSASFYFNGGQLANHSIASSLSGNLDSTETVIGASDNSGSDGAASELSHFSFWNETLDNQDMALVGQVWETEVEIDYDNANCEDVISYIGNKQNTAKINQLYYYDSSLTSYSGNLINATPPYQVLPNGLSSNDIMYVGIEQTSSSGNPDGPFSGLVFDVYTAANSSALDYAVTWQYYNGSWTSLSDVVDHTDNSFIGSLAVDGVNSIHWTQPGDWTTVDPGMGVTGYWVRMLVTSFSGTYTAPELQDKVYTPTQNKVVIPESALGGSMPSLATINVHNKSLTAGIERVVAGSRSTKTAPFFNSYINTGDEQNYPGISIVTLFADASIQTSTSTASGRMISLTKSTGSANVEEIFRVSIPSLISRSYTGTMKVFMIYDVQTAAASTTEFGYRVSETGAGDYTFIPTGNYINSSNGHTVHEVGEISIANDVSYNNDVGVIDLVWRSTVPNGLDVDFYAMVLIPTDEWWGDFDGVNVGRVFNTNQYLSIDSTTYHGRSLVAVIKNNGTRIESGRFEQSHSGSVIIDNEEGQNIHFLLMTSDANSLYEARSDLSADIKIRRLRRYHYGRGYE